MGNIEIFQAASISTTTPPPPRQPVQSGGGVTAPTPTTARPTLPPPDTGKTWGGPTSKVDLNFGHHPGVDEQGRPTLIRLHPSGVPVWAETDTALTPDQWVNMPKFQQEGILALLPLAWKDLFKAQMDKGDAKKAQTQPQGVDNSQVSPVATTLAEANQASQAPTAVADRARQQQAAAAQMSLVQELAQRSIDLTAEKTALIKDLADPKKAPEAQARLNHLDMQINEIQGVLHQIEATPVPANLSPAEAQTFTESLKQIGPLTQDLANPLKRAEAQAKLVVLYNHLQDPAHANQKDPVLMDQALAVYNLHSRSDVLMGEMDSLVADLSDPERAAEAQARMNLLEAQIRMVHEALAAVEAYRRPANLSAEDAQAVSQAFSEIDRTTLDLANPTRSEEAQARLAQLLQQLEQASLRHLQQVRG